MRQIGVMSTLFVHLIFFMGWVGTHVLKKWWYWSSSCLQNRLIWFWEIGAPILNRHFKWYQNIVISLLMWTLYPQYFEEIFRETLTWGTNSLWIFYSQQNLRQHSLIHSICSYSNTLYSCLPSLHGSYLCHLWMISTWLFMAMGEGNRPYI